MSFAPINIIIQKHGFLDDHLVLRVDTEDDTIYHCTYTQNSINSVTNFDLSTENVCEYLVLFCESIAKDTQKPDMIQFDIPAFPSIVLPAADAQYHITTVLRQIEFLHMMDDWPLETNPRVAPAHSRVVDEDSPKEY